MSDASSDTAQVDSSQLIVDASQSLGRASLDVVFEHFQEDDILRANLSVESVAIVGDRGAEFEPRVDGVGLVAAPSPPTIDFGSVAPATYGAIDLSLGQGGDPGFSVVLDVGDGLRILIEGPPAHRREVRCDAPTFVEAEALLHLELSFDLEEVTDALDEGPLPDPDESGLIRVNQLTAPDIMEEIEEDLVDAFRLSCTVSSP